MPSCCYLPEPSSLLRIRRRIGPQLQGLSPPGQPHYAGTCQEQEQSHSTDAHAVLSLQSTKHARADPAGRQHLPLLRFSERVLTVHPRRRFRGLSRARAELTLPGQFRSREILASVSTGLYERHCTLAYGFASVARLRHRCATTSTGTRLKASRPEPTQWTSRPRLCRTC